MCPLFTQFDTSDIAWRWQKRANNRHEDRTSTAWLVLHSDSDGELPNNVVGPFMQPVTRYAKSGEIHIAYQVFGDGPLTLVFVPLFVSNIELYWDQPNWARWLERLGSYARVAIFDKRGTGGSDRLSRPPPRGRRSSPGTGSETW